MAICPNCEEVGERIHEPCPKGDGYFLVDDEEYFSHDGDPWLGRHLGGKFVISAVLGQGSMGHVYRAYQQQVDRFVAIKIFETKKVQPGYASVGPEEQKRFIQEARVLAKLSHPNCVTLYDFGYDDNDEFLYIAMEHVKGISLRRAVRRGLKLDAIVQVVRQVLMALREAHALGIVHRDLKPENIILSYRQTSDEQIVKVLDFGIAKLLRKDHGERTAAGLLFGTPAYMSPEQCRGEPDVTAASDIYSLGCLIFEMVNGHLPFESKSPREMIRLHQEAALPPIVPRLGTELPDGFADFIRTCMAKDWRDRYSHAGEALQRFEEIVGEMPGGARLVGGLAQWDDEQGSMRVAVPENRLSGARLDPTGEFSRSEIAGAGLSGHQQPQKVRPEPMESGTKDTLRGKSSAEKSGPQRRVEVSQFIADRGILLVSAVLSVTVFVMLFVMYLFLDF